jgi:hypothetical protein
MNEKFHAARGLRTKKASATLLGATLVLALAAAIPLTAQAPTPQTPPPAGDKNSKNAGTRITPEQAGELFALVDELMKFSSEETGLPVKSSVKRQLTSRAEVEKYLKEKFDEDESNRRLQRGEIVLKKFGLLDRDFDLKPFLLELLTEQIQAYYDSKTKTVNMLDWVNVDEQKPVLAHELTHALQDQHVDLEKWSDQTPADVSTNYQEDVDHLAKDEMDTAREAVAEGQATAVMMDHMLKPMGKSLLKDPEIVEFIKQGMSGSQDSPVMARAPLLLSESLLFPYREGLSFEQDLWIDQGQKAAFAGVLDRPPRSTWEIINPREFEKAKIPVVPLLPDIHPVVDKLYKPYDIGQVGELDLEILVQLFGGEDLAHELTPAWDGGLYWAGQLRDATPAQQSSTKSIAFFYLSSWKSAASAQVFAKLYASSLGRKYSRLHHEENAGKGANAGGSSASDEEVYTTDEGPVVITTRDRQVFVAETFDLPTARKLTAMILDAQGSGDMRTTRSTVPPLPVPLLRVPSATLSGGLVHLFAESGVMKAAVEAGMRAAKQGSGQ